MTGSLGGNKYARAVVQTARFVYLLEFKIGDVVSALDQIKSKEYFQALLHGKREVILVGVAFDTAGGNLIHLMQEKYVR